MSAQQKAGVEGLLVPFTTQDKHRITVDIAAFHAAVAELIEAADGVDATHGPMLNGPVDPKVRQMALDRLRAALARVQGGA